MATTNNLALLSSMLFLGRKTGRTRDSDTMMTIKLYLAGKKWPITNVVIHFILNKQDNIIENLAE